MRSMLVAGTFIYVYLYVLKKKKREELTMWGGEVGEPVLNIYISEVALIFIRAAGLYEGGV